VLEGILCLLSIQHRSFTSSLSPRTYWYIESCRQCFFTD